MTGCLHVARCVNPDARTVTNTIAKSQSRQIAERSKMSAVALMLTCLSTHIFPCPPGTPPYVCPPNLPPGAKKSIDMMKKHYGCDVCVVHPGLVTSTDDMNIFVFRGELPKTNKDIKLVSKQAYDHKSTRSLWSEDVSEKSLNGLRVKIAVTISAAGQAAQLYIIVSVNEKQMPKDKTPDGVIVLEIEGLCFSGTVSPNNTSTGFLVFVRSDGTQAASVMRFKHQNKQIVKFVNEARQQIFSHVVVDGQAVPTNMKAICWCDGAFDQLTANVLNDEVWALMNILCNKQNPARTGVEQAADLARLFPRIRELLNKLSMFKECEHLKLAIQKILERKLLELKQAEKLILLKKDNDAIVDTVCTLPTVAGEVFTHDVIKAPFKQNGMIDEVTEHVPDYYNLLKKTTTQTLYQEDTDNIDAKFPMLMKVQLDKGFVPDAIFELAGIPPDLDNNGNIVRRDHAITNENRQRAKTTNHPEQKADRKKVLDDINEAKEKSHTVEKIACEKLLESNFKCEELVKQSYMIRTSQDFDSFTGAIVDDFDTKGIKCDDLKAFIQVREQTTSKRAKGSKALPNKGTLAKAKDGVDCLIKYAYDVREKPITLVVPPELEDAAAAAASFKCII